MAIATHKKLFFDSVEGKWLRKELLKMTEDPQYNTKSSYTATSEDRLTFVDKHMNYMSNYRDLNHLQYLSNLKMKTKLR